MITIQSSHFFRGREVRIVGIRIKLLCYSIIFNLFWCARIERAHYTHDRRRRGTRKDTFQKTSQILPADYTCVYYTRILWICAHRCRIKRTMCRRYAPQESGRITHTWRVVRASVSGTRFIRNDSNIILFTVEQVSI